MLSCDACSGGRHPILVLFSRSGFTEALQVEAAAGNVLLVGLEQLLGKAGATT